MLCEVSHILHVSTLVLPGIPVSSCLAKSFLEYAKLPLVVSIVVKHVHCSCNMIWIQPCLLRINEKSKLVNIVPTHVIE